MFRAMTPRVLLIGYGNPLRGDDALGPMAVERLRPLLTDAELLSCHQLAPELAERLAGCELALFVDAAACGEPGTVRLQRRLRPQADGVASLTHHVQPAALLALAQELYGRAPAAMLVTGSGATFDATIDATIDGRESLSAQGRAALDEICRLVPLLIQDFRATGDATGDAVATRW
jgi:hydrogenase maturation protease